MAIPDYFSAMQGVSEKKDEMALKDIHVQQQRFDNILNNYANRRQQQQQFDATKELQVKQLDLRERAFAVEADATRLNMEKSAFELDTARQGLAAQSEASALSKSILEVAQNTGDPDAVLAATQEARRKATSFGANALLGKVGDEVATSLKTGRIAEGLKALDTAQRTNQLALVKEAYDLGVVSPNTPVADVAGMPDLGPRLERAKVNALVTDYNSFDPKAEPLKVDDFFIEGIDGRPVLKASELNTVAKRLAEKKKAVDVGEQYYARALGTGTGQQETGTVKGTGGKDKPSFEFLNGLNRTIFGKDTTPEQRADARRQYNDYAATFPGRIPAIPEPDPEIQELDQVLSTAMKDDEIRTGKGSPWFFSDSAADELVPSLRDALQVGGKPEKEIDQIVEEFGKKRGKRLGILREARDLVRTKQFTDVESRLRASTTTEEPQEASPPQLIIDRLAKAKIGDQFEFNGQVGTVANVNGKKRWVPEE